MTQLRDLPGSSTSQDARTKAPAASAPANLPVMVPLVGWEMADLGHLTVDADDIIQAVEPVATRMLAGGDNAVGRKFTDFVADRDLSRYALFRQLIILQGTPHACALRLGESGSNRSWVYVSAAWRRSHLGRDVTDYVLTDLDHNEYPQPRSGPERHPLNREILFLSSPVAIVATDSDGVIEAMNFEASRVLGYAPSELIGRKDEILVPHRLREVHRDHHHAYLFGSKVSGMVLGQKLPVQHRDGSEFPAEIKLSSAQTGSGVLILAAIRDLTEEDAAEMGRMDALRLAEQATTLANKANQAKERFLAVLSHELRTPLAPVMATLAILQASPGLSAEDREALNRIRRSVQLEVSLIDDLLDLVQVNQGKLSMKFASVDLLGLLNEVVGLTESGRGAKDLALRIEARASSHVVWGDAVRLRQVLWNLLSNAAKFTPRGGAITVSTEDASPERVALTVVDTGCGIDASFLPHVFNAFEQGTNARQFGGLGLGLSISSEVVQLHGGSLSASSEGTDRGSAFRLELSTGAQHETTEVQRASAVRREAAGGGVGGRRRLLLVEDDPDTSFAMHRLLCSWGYEVEVAATCAEALRWVEDEKFDLLISDLGLPDGSGVELMQKIRAQHPLRGIALSGFGMKEDQRVSLAAGFSAHLVKPVEIDRLQSLIAELLKGDEGEHGH
jgi:PAS domain S-box-containing protein